MDIGILSYYDKYIILKRIKQKIGIIIMYCDNDKSVIIKDVPDHSSDLKNLDDSIFLSVSKCYSIFLHPGGACHPFHLCSILYNTNQIISNKIYKDNHLSGCVYPMIKFVLGLSTHACHQKDSKLLCFVSPHLVV